MRLIAMLSLVTLALAGCEQCAPGPHTNVNVGVGTGGVHGGVSVGQRCGPINISIGTGNYYHVPF